jgi:NAD(P)-dependent dehydrogenase (short-subunit alcohol dehydrogenase family)
MSEESIFSLAGKTCLVTGASSGIGRVCCIEIAAAGGVVIATARNEERLAETLASLPGDEHQAIPTDLLEASDRERLIAACPDLDGIVHSAGVNRLAPVRFATEKVFAEILSVNLEAPLFLTRELLCARRIRGGASNVFISSSSAVTGGAGLLAYASSKSALLGATKVIAGELARERIRCNCLLPAMVRTPMTEGGMLTAEQICADERRYPLGYGKPEDVAAAAVFFLSDASRWITGQSLILDGGRWLG